MVAANPVIVAVGLSPEIPPYGARANSRVQQPWRWRESLHWNDLRAVGKAAIIRAIGVGSGGQMLAQRVTDQQLAPDTHKKLCGLNEQRLLFLVRFGAVIRPAGHADDVSSVTNR